MLMLPVESTSVPQRPDRSKHSLTVSQAMPDRENRLAYYRKNAAFEEWRQKRNPGDRLPRGRFFKGKRPGQKLYVMDELWRAIKT